MIEDTLIEIGQQYRNEKNKIQVLKENYYSINRTSDILEQVIEPFLGRFKTLLKDNMVSISVRHNTVVLTEKDSEWNRVNILGFHNTLTQYFVGFNHPTRIIQAYQKIIISDVWRDFIDVLLKICHRNADYDLLIASNDRNLYPHLQKAHNLIDKHSYEVSLMYNPIVNIRPKDNITFLTYEGEFIRQMEWINNGKKRGTLYLTLNNQTIDGIPVKIGIERKMSTTIDKLVNQYLRNIFWYNAGI